jgi:hypothetical protein
MVLPPAPIAHFKREHVYGSTRNWTREPENSILALGAMTFGWGASKDSSSAMFDSYRAARAARSEEWPGEMIEETKSHDEISRRNRASNKIPLQGAAGKSECRR